MEGIIGYVIIFIVGLSVLYAYQWKKTKKRALPISIQAYADAIFEFYIQKQNGETKEYLLKLTAKRDIILKQLTIELIDRNRETAILKIQAEHTEPINIQLTNGQSHIFRFEPQSLKNLMEKQEVSFHTFRFVVENQLGKKYKTHELAFNKKWSLYKPDSGTYN